MMNKKENRMEQLVNAGINTGKYFTFELPEGLEPGSKVHLVIDENGAPKMVPGMLSQEDRSHLDNLANILNDGYVKNTRLFRRWVTAQMFRNLNYKSYDGKETGYNAALKRYPYKYTFEMMLEEVRVLGKLEVRDAESFVERSMFFTKDVVVKVCNDYMDKLKAHVNSLQVKRCKKVPYVRVKGENIFVEDLNKKIYQPLQYRINRIKFADNYTDMYVELQRFVRDMIKLPWDTPKSKDWIDAYKGNGAYYTCKNLIMYHNCKVKDENMRADYFFDRDASMKILKSKLMSYQGEGWRMFAFMKKLIADNNFSFEDAMRKQYGRNYGKRMW